LYFNVSKAPAASFTLRIRRAFAKPQTGIGKRRKTAKFELDESKVIYGNKKN